MRPLLALVVLAAPLAGAAAAPARIAGACTYEGRAHRLGRSGPTATGARPAGLTRRGLLGDDRRQPVSAE
jgi:hypothetical protein